MRLRSLLIVFAISFTGIMFSACTDESENIVPQPVNTDEAQTATGNGTKEDDIN